MIRVVYLVYFFIGSWSGLKKNPDPDPYPKPLYVLYLSNINLIYRPILNCIKNIFMFLILDLKQNILCIERETEKLFFLKVGSDSASVFLILSLIRNPEYSNYYKFILNIRVRKLNEYWPAYTNIFCCW